MTIQPDAEVSELEALRREVAALKAAIAAPPPPAGKAKQVLIYDLLLSNGARIEHHGAVPTHYHDGETDEVYQVVGATERKRA